MCRSTCTAHAVPERWRPRHVRDPGVAKVVLVMADRLKNERGTEAHVRGGRCVTVFDQKTRAAGATKNLKRWSLTPVSWRCWRALGVGELEPSDSKWFRKWIGSSHMTLLNESIRRSVVFWSFMVFSVLLFSILFYFILIYSVLFLYVLFVLLCCILFCSNLLCYFLSHPILFNSIHFGTVFLFCSIFFNSFMFYSTLF